MGARTFAGLALALLVSGCDQLFEQQSKRALEVAETKEKTGDFRGAVKFYEAALDGTAATADVHYRLATIYEDKLKSPLDALHHFQRYLDLAPKGHYALEARNYKREGELKLMTSLGKGNFISQEEAARLKNENLSLRNTIVSLRAQKSAPPQAVPRGEQVQKPIPPGSRTHTVEPGETLASIALRYYKTRARWKDIQDANFYALEGTAKIKPGQTLIIP